MWLSPGSGRSTAVGADWTCPLVIGWRTERHVATQNFVGWRASGKHARYNKQQTRKSAIADCTARRV